MDKTCFRDEQQRSSACRALLATGELGHLWTERGPTDEARRLLAEVPKPPLSAGHRVLFLAAWAFWTGERLPFRFDELVGLPEAEPICKLMTATIYGPKAIDVWLTRSDVREDFVATPEDAHAAAAQLYDEARAVFAEGGDDPINFTAAPDACALGASRMAEYALTKGVKPIRSDKARTKAALELTAHVLGLYARMERDLADGSAAEDDDDEEPSTTE